MSELFQRLVRAVSRRRERRSPFPLELWAKMAALGAYPMSWERFYQLEHDGPWRGLAGIRAGSLTCTATYSLWEKSFRLDLRWRLLLPGIWSRNTSRVASSRREIHTVVLDILRNEFLRLPGNLRVYSFLYTIHNIFLRISSFVQDVPETWYQISSKLAKKVLINMVLNEVGKSVGILFFLCQCSSDFLIIVG